MTTTRLDRTTTNKPTRAGYAWVEDRRVKAGGYWRKLPRGGGGVVSSMGKLRSPGGNQLLKSVALLTGGAIAGGAVGILATKWSSSGGSDRQVREARKKAEARAKKIVELEMQVRQKASEVEGQIREISDRVNREAMRQVADARAAASQAAQDEIKRSLEPKAKRPGVLIDDEKQGIALGASVRQGMTIGFDPVSRENLDRRVREATNRLSGRHLTEGMQALSTQFREKAGQIVSNTNQTADAGWLEMKKLLAAQNTKEGALAEEVDNLRKAGLQEYRTALDSLHKKAEQAGGYSDEMLAAFDRKSKTIYTKMRRDIQNYSNYVQRDMKTKWDSASSTYRYAYQSALGQA